MLLFTLSHGRKRCEGDIPEPGLPKLCSFIQGLCPCRTQVPEESRTTGPLPGEAYGGATVHARALTGTAREQYRASPDSYVQSWDTLLPPVEKREGVSDQAQVPEVPRQRRTSDPVSCYSSWGSSRGHGAGSVSAPSQQLPRRPVPGLWDPSWDSPASRCPSVWGGEEVPASAHSNQQKTSSRGGAAVNLSALHPQPLPRALQSFFTEPHSWGVLQCKGAAPSRHELPPCHKGVQ